MKKIFTVFLTVLLLAFSACSQSDGTQDSTTEEPPVGPIDWDYWEYQFNYDKSTNPSLDLFINWLESGGTLIVNKKNYSEYDRNNAILDWAASQDKILIPKPTDDTMLFHSLTTSKYKNYYRIVFNNKENNTWIIIAHIPLTEEESGKDLETLVKEVQSGNKQYQKGTCEKWGEYIYDNYGAFILHENYLLYIHTDVGEASWSPDDLSLVDFVFVPLNMEETDSSSPS